MAERSLDATAVAGRKGNAVRLCLGVAFGLVAIAIAVTLFRSARQSAPLSLVPPPISPAIEERWGIRVTRLAVTADGGMVDFRYQVIDPNKALALADSATQTLAGSGRPLVTLVAEDTGQKVEASVPMPHKDDLVVGRTYFVLYGNTVGAIKRGRPVTIVIGDLRLEHVIAW